MNSTNIMKIKENMICGVQVKIEQAMIEIVIIFLLLYFIMLVEMKKKQC
jgi:hypothetical protein